MARLEGKIAIVTGGASGIGRAVAEGFAKAGAKVCVADISQEKCDQVAREIGLGAMGHALDVCQQASIDTCVDAVVEKFGAVNTLVNCAGVFGMQMFADITAEEFDRVVAVNSKGLLFMTQAVVRRMLAGGSRGAVVNIASGAGRRGQPGATVYALSKAAVISITQSAGLELVGQGIRVNAIAPGSVMTPMWEQVRDTYGKILGEGADPDKATVDTNPSGRISVPADYVGAAIYLASDESDYVVGQTLNVDGGYLLN
ncbi:MAG: glucose 1-dehydrogenase [Porticoccaceae bacterium]